MRTFIFIAGSGVSWDSQSLLEGLGDRNQPPQDILYNHTQLLPTSRKLEKVPLPFILWFVVKLFIIVLGGIIDGILGILQASMTLRNCSTTMTSTVSSTFRPLQLKPTDIHSGAHTHVHRNTPYIVTLYCYYIEIELMYSQGTSGNR